MLEDRYIIRRIQNHVDNGINSEDGDVTNVRQNMFSRYMGEAYGNEREGFSKYVSREVLQAVEWGLPSLLRVFTGGVKAVDFKPSGPDDVDQAKHETDVVNYWFFDGNEDGSGFMVLYSWLKDILMYPNGYVKVSVEEHEENETQSFEGLTDEQLDMLEEQADEDADIEVTRKYKARDEQTGAKVVLYDVNVNTSKWSKRICVEPIAPDECIISHTHNKLDVDGADFVCIRTQKSRSDLMLMGYDEEVLEDLSPNDDEETWNEENIVQHFYVDEEPDTGDDTYDLPADERFWVHECYMMIDYNEDGVNELRKIVMAGCKILENEECDFQPIVAASAIHITHKHIGMSYAEIVADLQELMTTLTRQLLDNIYKQNVARRFINENALTSDNETMNQLLDGTSENILVRGPPLEAVMAEQVTPIVAEIGGVIEQLKEGPQMRTGVAPQLALDPSVLEKSTMGAFVGALEQASQRLELLARLFAETGLKKVFQKVHYCLRTYFDEKQQVQVNGQWVEIDPSKWKRRGNMTVNVGLGFNNKQAMLGLLTQLLQIQKEAMQLGVADAKKIYATLEKLVEQANLGHATTYFNDPNQPDFTPPPPAEDAALIMAKAQAAALDAESKRKDRELDAKIKYEADKLAAQIAKDKEDAEAKAADLNQKLMDYKLRVDELQAKIAETDANIQAMNAKGSEPGGADDEFDRADTRTADLTGGKPGGAKPKPAAKARPKAKPQEKLAA